MRAYISDWWKFTATGLAGVVVTIATAYLSSYGDLVTRPQVREMIKTESPYSQDRALIQERLDISRSEQARLNQKFDAILDGQNKMSNQLSVLTEQVQQIKSAPK
jgi:flagellar capping protein FliD